MTSFRDIKRRARQDLHRHMFVPALYLVPGEVSGTYEEQIPCNVRVHTHFTSHGDLKGTNFHYAERRDTDPEIVFMRDEVMLPARNAIVSIVAGEAYRIGDAHPSDDITITVSAARLRQADTVGLPIPESA